MKLDTLISFLLNLTLTQTDSFFNDMVQLINLFIAIKQT